MGFRAIQPLARPIDARLELPGSKSYSNRALVCAALAGHPVSITNISPSGDTALMLNVLADLGWSITRPNPVSRDVRLAPPKTPRPSSLTTEIRTGDAGTATRFACALLAALPGRFKLDCSERMRERPIRGLLDALRQLGAKIEGGGFPLTIEGATLRGGTCTLDASDSSQFLSALLMVAPTRGQPTLINLSGPLTSVSYVDVTIEVMRAFGLPKGYARRDGDTFHAQPAQYTGREYSCPPDATGAGYFWAAAAITGGKGIVGGLRAGSPQGDVALVGMLENMGCKRLDYPNGLGIDATTCDRLSPINADLSELPDSAPTLAVVCAFAEGTSVLTGLSTLRGKECDRLAALESELTRLGATVTVNNDQIRIEGGLGRLKGAKIKTYDDHRIAMSFALAGLKVPGVEIESPGCVAKSFPGFWDLLGRL